VIFRRVRRRWLTRAILILRWSRGLAYLLIAGAGVSAILSPPASVATAANGRLVTFVWAGLMAVSAAACALGAFTDRWVGEYVGLIPLSLVAAVFGLSALSRGQASLSGGLFLLGFFWILISRWQEVALLRVESERRLRSLRERTRDGSRP
jgi:hypothetical protein